MAGNNPIGYSDLFNFNDNAEILKAIKSIKELSRTYKQFQSEVTGPQLSVIVGQLSGVSTEIKKIASATTALNITNEQGQKALAANLKLIEQLRLENENLRKAKAGVKATEDAVAGSVNELNNRLKTQVKEWRNVLGIAVYFVN